MLKKSSAIRMMVVMGITLLVLIVVAGVKITNLQEQVTSLQEDYDNLKVDYQNTTIVLSNCLTNKMDLQIKNSELEKLPLFNMNPTLRQVQGVMSTDYSNEKPYIDYEYDCVDYSTDLSNALLDQKIHSCVTWLYFSEDEGHALVAVNTSDYGIVYIEPQTDKIIYSLELGDDYCDKANWDCTWKINKIKSCYQ